MIVIMCESIYDPKLIKQILKRVHQQKNLNEIYYYMISFDTMIEKMTRIELAEKPQ